MPLIEEYLLQSSKTWVSSSILLCKERGLVDPVRNVSLGRSLQMWSLISRSKYGLGVNFIKVLHL